MRVKRHPRRWWVGAVVMTIGSSTVVLGQSQVSESLDAPAADPEVNSVAAPAGFETVEVVLLDGSRFRGRLVSDSEDMVVVETSLGRLEIDRTEIETMTPLIESPDGKDHWRPSANQTRLFFAPTGRSLAKGEGYFADYYLFFPSVTYGVTDRFTFSGGVSLFPGAGLNQLYYAGAKLGVSQWEHGGAGVGVLAMGANWDDLDPFGVVYGVATTGTERSSATFGFGFGYYGSDLADSPLVMVGGQTRVSERVELVSENYIGMDLGDAALVSYGFRFLAASMTVDFGFWTVLESEAGFFPGLPYIDFVFKL